MEAALSEDHIALRDKLPAEPQARADADARPVPILKSVGRVEIDRVEVRPPADPAPKVPTPPAAARSGHIARLLVASGKRLATLIIALVAIVIAALTWQDYVMSPWTRNGNVRVQVANVAPQVSGQIVDLKVVDNQFVHEGDVLYVIDPFDFEVAMHSSKAQVDGAAADLELKQVQSDRRQHLSNLATTPEEQQTYASAAAQAKATFDAAQQQLAQAELNLMRTKVLSPVNGYVTNLLLRVGDYAPTGQSNISVIDSDSYWIDGYFEETKMARICVGDQAEAKLMGYADPIVGHVETITRGISVSNAAAGTQGLPDVDPIYTWVRLAQRVPVRIAVDHVPPGIPLVSGMTETITIMEPEGDVHQPNLRGVYNDVVDRLSQIVSGPPAPRPGCLPAVTSQATPTEMVPVSKEPPALNPEQIEPGIAPGMDISPQTN